MPISVNIASKYSRVKKGTYVLNVMSIDNPTAGERFYIETDKEYSSAVRWALLHPFVSENYIFRLRESIEKVEAKLRWIAIDK